MNNPNYTNNYLLQQQQNARNKQRRASTSNPDYCGKYFLRSVLYVFNVVFWMTGAAFLAVGLYVLVTRHSFVSLLGSTMFPITTYLLVAIGVLVIVIGILGCIGACTENRCCLFTFASFLLLIFLLEAVSGILAYMYAGVIREELTRNLNDTMMQSYKFNTQITDAIDSMQIQFQCCGAGSFEDWRYSRWLRPGNETEKAPTSCCKTVSIDCGESDHPSNIQYMGCSRKLEQYTQESLILIGGIALGLCCVQIIGIIFSCCLIRKIKEGKTIDGRY